MGLSCYADEEIMMENEKDKGELKLTYSSIFKLNGESCSSICFEQEDKVAEGIIPFGKITKSSGFTEEEIEQLEQYLVANAENLMEKAKKISGLPHLLS